MEYCCEKFQISVEQGAFLQSNKGDKYYGWLGHEKWYCHVDSDRVGTRPLILEHCPHCGAELNNDS